MPKGLLLLDGFEEEEDETSYSTEKMTVDEGKRGQKRATSQERATASASKPAKGGGGKQGAKAGGKGKQSKGEDSSSSSEKKHVSQAMLENKALMSLMVKQILNSAQTGRDLMGVLYDTWIVPIECQMIQVAKKQNMKYSEKVKTRGHGLGPPHLYTFGGVLAGLASMVKDTENMVPVQQVIENYIEKEATAKGETIKFCRINKVYDSSKFRLTMAFSPTAEAMTARQIIMTALHKQQEFEHKQGRPPPSFMERELADWLQALLA